MSHLLELRDWLDAEIARLEGLRDAGGLLGPYYHMYCHKIDALFGVRECLEQQIAKAAAGLPAFSNPPPFGGWRGK